ANSGEVYGGDGLNKQSTRGDYIGKKQSFSLPFIIIIMIAFVIALFLGGRFMINALKPKPVLVTGFPETSSPPRDDFLMRLSTIPQQSIISMKDDNVHLAQFKS